MLHFGKSVPHRLQGVCAAFAVMVTGDNVEHKPPRPVATKSVHLSTSDDDVIFAHSPLEIGCDFLRQLLFHLKPNVTLQEDYARVKIDETALWLCRTLYIATRIFLVKNY
jgi:hypothetical protein